MKNLYGKTSKSTYFSVFSEPILVRMQDFSYLVNAVSKRPLVLPAVITISGSFLCFAFESVFPGRKYLTYGEFSFPGKIPFIEF
jgi:hypothetical protein